MNYQVVTRYHTDDPAIVCEDVEPIIFDNYERALSFKEFLEYTTNPYMIWYEIVETEEEANSI